MERKDYDKQLPVFFNGKPYHGDAFFIYGYNGYASSDSDGCLCALIKDPTSRNEVKSCWDRSGKPNQITDEKGNPIRMKHRRGTYIELNGYLHISYEDYCMMGSIPG